MTLVLDASMAVAWLFVDEETPTSDLALLLVTEQGAVVPSLWHLEVANVLRNAVRRQRCKEASVDLSLARLARLPIRVDEHTDRQAWGATRALSREEGLTLYDAAYLELAIRRALPLATTDDALFDAARRRNVPIIAA